MSLGSLENVNLNIFFFKLLTFSAIPKSDNKYYNVSDFDYIIGKWEKIHVSQVMSIENGDSFCGRYQSGWIDIWIESDVYISSYEGDNFLLFFIPSLSIFISDLVLVKMLEYVKIIKLDAYFTVYESLGHSNFWPVMREIPEGLFLYIQTSHQILS